MISLIKFALLALLLITTCYANNEDVKSRVLFYKVENMKKKLFGEITVTNTGVAHFKYLKEGEKWEKNIESVTLSKKFISKLPDFKKSGTLEVNVDWPREVRSLSAEVKVLWNLFRQGLHGVSMNSKKTKSEMVVPGAS